MESSLIYNSLRHSNHLDYIIAIEGMHLQTLPSWSYSMLKVMKEVLFIAHILPFVFVFSKLFLRVKWVEAGNHKKSNTTFTIM
jgi:hypothetical protein